MTRWSAPSSHATTTTRTTSKMSGPMVTPFRGDATLRVCRWQEFRERLPHRLGDRRVLRAEAREGMGRLDVQLYPPADGEDRKSTRLNSSHSQISYAVFCL